MLKGWKTAILNAAVMIGAASQLVTSLQIPGLVISPSMYLGAIILLATANLVLRFVTTTPIFSKLPDLSKIDIPGLPKF